MDYPVKITDYKLLEYINLDYAEIIDYGVTMLGAPLEWDSLEKVTGKGIKVLVLDTGSPQHKDLTIEGYKNFTTDKSVIDSNSHSTHVVGILSARRNGFGIIGGAPEVTVYCGKVLKDEGGGGKWEWLADGIRWGIELGVDIISMSLGGEYASPVVEQAVKDAYKKGIILIAAAGNSGNSNKHYPASFKEVISVGAVNLNKDKAGFSTYNEDVEVTVAGVDVISTYLDNKYAKMSGTSMATPLFSSAVALLLQKAKIRHGRKLTSEEVRFISSIYSEDRGKVGKDSSFGFGVFSFGRIIKEEIPPVEIEFTIGSNKYLINGVEKEMDTAPILDDNDRILIPIRYSGQSLGADVVWNPNEPNKVKLVRK